MRLPTVNPVSTSYYQNVRTQEEKDKLGKDDFLKILVAQLSHQDPLNPMQDKEFIGQMTGFSTLEQIVNLNGSFSKFAAAQSGLSSYSASIGKEITWLDDSANGSQKGIVTGVAVRDGKAYYMTDGQEIPVEKVDTIRQPQI